MMDTPPGFRGAFHTDRTARALYSEGAGPFRLIPAAVAFPTDVDDLALLAMWATGTGTPLTPRGAGSGMPGSNIGPGIVVDLRAFDRPLSVTLAHTATVGAAVTCQQLNDTAGHFGFRLPPDPSSGRFCTLGGMVATNAAGARSLKYGSIRRWVRGVELVTTDGEVFWLHREGARPERPPTSRLVGDHPKVLKRLDAAHLTPSAQGFPRTTKNSAGYALDQWAESGDVLDLIIGSEGTLAFITRVELALDHVPRRVTSRLVPLASLDDLATVVPALRAAGPAAIELLDRSFLDLVQSDVAPGAAAVLLVDFEDDAPDGVPGVAMDREALWALRHAASPALARLPDEQRSLQVIEDGCVPIAQLAEYIRGVHEAARAAGVRIVAFGHAGDGHLHVNALADLDQPGMRNRLLGLRDAVTELVIRLGGTPSGEHGDGRLRADGLERLYGSAMVAAFRAVKAAFDPAGVLNPGVILPAGPLPPFKGGPGAPALDPAVAQALRDRERDARWDVPPLSLLEEPV